MYEAYAGDKNIIKFEGDHNSNRPAFFFDSAVIFLTNTLQLDALLTEESKMNPEQKEEWRAKMEERRKQFKEAAEKEKTEP